MANTSGRPTKTYTTRTMIIRTTPTAAVFHEQIRGRAYEIYEQRGREDGHDLEDWRRLNQNCCTDPPLNATLTPSM